MAPRGALAEWPWRHGALIQKLYIVCSFWEPELDLSQLFNRFCIEEVRVFDCERCDGNVVFPKLGFVPPKWGECDP